MRFRQLTGRLVAASALAGLASSPTGCSLFHPDGSVAEHNIAAITAASTTPAALCAVTLSTSDISGPWLCPIPVPQVIGDYIQDHKYRQYDEVPLMPPVRDYAPTFCQDPPSEYDVIRAMQPPNWFAHIPFLCEEHYNNMQIVPEKIVDSLDECRFYPLVGPARLHHCHFKVTVYFDHIEHSSYPFSWWVEQKDVEVLYIDKDHLHICTSEEMEQIPESYADIYGAY